MEIYLKLWRGPRSKFTQSSFVLQMVQFCEKYAEPLLLRDPPNPSLTHSACLLRETYKRVLLQLEEDVKVDQEETKSRIRKLMEAE